MPPPITRFDMATHEQLVALLRLVASGDAQPVAISDPRFTDWSLLLTTEVTYRVQAWTVTIRVDDKRWGYIDSVVTPDGRRFDCEAWLAAGYRDATDDLDDVERRCVESDFRAAAVTAGRRAVVRRRAFGVSE